MIERGHTIGKPCPVCSSTDIWVFLETSQLPAHCNILWPTRDEALQAPTGAVQLGFCGECGHIFNVSFDAGLIDYRQRYENSLHSSAHFQQYAVSLATRLIEQYDLHGKSIIEIGCGKGEFLTLLCELGDNRGVGFDPGCIPNPTADRLVFIKDFYSHRYSDYKADFICCRHVLEHVSNPYEFLTMLGRTIDGQRNTGVYIEVPNALLILRSLAIWDIIYEHSSYFSKHSLVRLLTECGFNVCNLAETFHDQFLCIEGVPGDGVENPTGNPLDDLTMVINTVAAFAGGYRDKTVSWRKRIERMEQNTQRVVVWGAGSKGITFLNVLKVRDQIQYVVDINPRKHGMYIAGTGQRIVPPEFLLDYQPDVVIVMNAVYKREIQAALNELGLKAACESALD